MATNTYVALDKQTLSSAVLNVTFSSIPSTYTDLVLVCSYVRSGGGNNISLRLNGDTTNYSETYLEGDGTSAVSGRNSNDSNMRVAFIQGGTGTSQSTMILNFQNYANTTTYKNVLTRYSEASTGTGSSVGLWRSTAAINSIEIGRSATVNFAAGSTFSLYGIKAAASSSPKATGGTIYEDSIYWYHAFGATGTFTPNQSLSCDYLVVAGGGGGSYDTGGGGGGGGLRSTVTATGGGGSLETALSLSATAYTVTIGAGGTGALTGSRRGANGSDSTLSTVTSTGGGGGGTAHGGGLDGSTGGSGGGGSRSGGNGGARTTNQGFAGGNGTGGTTGAGGGGGAGSAGTSASTGGGAGGNGVGISINGSLSYYAGGGGGGSNTIPPAAGGIGGGGQGGTPGGLNITPGTANLGGGGGGCGGGDSTGNASGGSGIVIVRYAK